MIAGMCRIPKPSRNILWSRLGLQRAWFLKITHPAHPGYLTSALLFSKMVFTTLCRATVRHHGTMTASTPSVRNIKLRHLKLHHNFITTTSTREEIQWSNHRGILMMHHWCVVSNKLYTILTTTLLPNQYTLIPNANKDDLFSFWDPGAINSTLG